MKQTAPNKVSILFLCTGNSCRSQMAEGWANTLKAQEIEAYSAGIEKHGLNPSAAKVMAEAGVDISSQHSKLLNELPVQKFDWIITLCGQANETCPFFPGRKMHHGFDDPPQLARNAQTEEEKLAHYRRVRDEIRDFIASLPGSLSSASMAMRTISGKLTKPKPISRTGKVKEQPGQGNKSC